MMGQAPAFKMVEQADQAAVAAGKILLVLALAVLERHCKEIVAAAVALAGLLLLAAEAAVQEAAVLMQAQGLLAMVVQGRRPR